MGPHSFLGARLAENELRIVFVELLVRFPKISLIRPPRRLRSNFIAGIKELRGQTTSRR